MFATRLADESRRLDLLKAGDLEVRASFGLSYRGRAETEQRAFRLLGLLGADFAAWNLAALTGTDADDAEDCASSWWSPLMSQALEYEIACRSSY